MISLKILKCIYTIEVSGKMCEGIIKDYNEFGIKQIKAISKFYPTDIEAFNKLENSIINIVKNSKIFPELKKEFSPEFYPSENGNLEDFKSEISIKNNGNGTESIVIRATTNFDKNGDFKIIKVSSETKEYSLFGSVLIDPDVYMKQKQLEYETKEPKLQPTKIIVH